MELTKYTHACVTIASGSRRLAIDPGVFSESAEALAGTEAVLITHEHADHLDVDALTAAARRDSGLHIWAPASAAARLTALGSAVTAVSPGESFTAAGMPIRTFGGQHAIIHPSVPAISNIGYLVGGAIYHPGDAFAVPDVDVATLLIPTSSPWSKTAEVLDFMIAVRAPQSYQVHDALWGPIGTKVVESHLHRVAGEYGLAFEHLDPGQTREG